MMNDTRWSNGEPEKWKRYPYVVSPTDPELTFPAAEGDQGAESNTFYVAGRLRGTQSGRPWAFLVIFTGNDIRHRVRADFHTFALFDLTTGSYGTFSDFDLPRPPRVRRNYKLSVAKGHLNVSYQSSAGGSRWATARDPHGELVPFTYDLTAVGRDDAGQPMRLELALETRKPPMPVGGDEYAGVKTCMGQFGTHSYFQSDVRFRGTLEWGDQREDVEGDSGWIDRQWTPRYLGIHSDRRNSGYRHEWRQIHLDNGFEMSVWLHVDRHRHNLPIPFCGATGATPDGRVLGTTEFHVDRLSFVRDPGHVQPRYSLSSGPKYFADRYRLRVPAWELDLFSEPLVEAPAHRLPIEYWSGPTRIQGIMAGKPVGGFGFHERTLAFCRDFELVCALRQSVRHLPTAAFPPGLPSPLEIANQVWEVDGFLSHGDRDGARQHLETRVRPSIKQLAGEPRRQLLTLLDDLQTALS